MENKILREIILKIADGVPLRINNVMIKIDGGKLLVIYWTKTYFLINVTKENSLIELADLKNNFSDLKQQFEEIQDLIELNRLKIE